MSDLEQYFDTLEILLEHEREHLLKGEIAQVSENSQKIAQLLETPPKVNSSERTKLEAQFHKLQQSAQRNQTLYQTAINAAAKTRKVLQTIEETCHGLNTYSENGTVGNVIERSRNMEKKF